MPSDFNDLYEQLKQGVIDLAESTVKKYASKAKADGKQMLEDMKERLKRWTELLTEEKLTTEEFEWLINSQKDLIQMAALQQSGLAVIRIDQFVASLLNMIVDTVFSFLKI